MTHGHQVRNLVWASWLGAGTLCLELLLIRIFDAIVGTSAAYALVGGAVFGIGLAGAFQARFPSARHWNPDRYAWSLALTLIALWGVLRFIPFSVSNIPHQPWLQIPSFLLLVVLLLAPFFLSALAVLRLLQGPQLSRVYAADLAGAAAGPWALPWLLPWAGPAGIFALLAGGHLALAPVFLTPNVQGRPQAGSKEHLRPGSARVWLGLALAILGGSGVLGSWDLPSHSDKRSAEERQLREESAEFRRWDPVSKIEVVNLPQMKPMSGEFSPTTYSKLISYDGGAQSSHIYRFDGDYAALREQMDQRVLDHFWQRGVLAAHWLLRDSNYRVFVAGCAGGQEVKASLVYGAREVLAVDLVETVVDLGRERYAEYNGGLFLDPQVTYRAAEARTELARAEEPFDLIQIFSYHNSSRVAAGSLALKAFYLQTAETYALCMDKLTPDGVLQIHQGFFPKLVVTLAEAWSQLGRTNLEQHVVIYGRDTVEDHYTTLIKNSPWTKEELADLDAFLLADFPGDDATYRVWESPLDAGASFLPRAFYDVPLDPEFRHRCDFRLHPTTDDRPFSHFLRKRWGTVEADRAAFTTTSEAIQLNQIIPKRVPIPRDILHIVALGFLTLVTTLVFLVLANRSAGRSRSPSRERAFQEMDVAIGKRSGLYFYLVGLGFIGIEWCFVQYALQLVALPLQSFALALSTVLIGAAMGSLASHRITTGQAVIGIIVSGGLVGAFLPQWIPSLWASPLAIRLTVMSLVLLPTSFFLGIPFPRGLARLQGESTAGAGASAAALAGSSADARPNVGVKADAEAAAAASLTAWAWTWNGLATVTGSLAVAVLFAVLGIRATFVCALVCYVAAALVYERVTSPKKTRRAGPVNA